jgi:hypothetical protein
MIRGSFRIGLVLGTLGGAAAAAVRVLQGRRSPQQEADPPGPPVELDRAEPGGLDAAAAPGPEPQPARQGPAGEGGLPGAEVTGAVGRGADDLARDRRRQPASATPDWTVAAEAGAAAPADDAWAPPEPGGSCPSTHPVKAKMSSKIFHLPGMRDYERTAPDRCYIDAAAAEADGLRPAKR